MIQTLATTTNFVIQYQDTFGDALRRAQALQITCESDFSRCKQLFGVTAGFGSSNRVTLSIDAESLAKNNGYHTDGTTRVTITPFDGNTNPGLADDGVRALFIAEIVEVLMGYRNNKPPKNTTWHADQSDGEGLSRVLAAEFYPEAYYNKDLLNGPFINDWIRSSNRRDWVSKNESSDTDRMSFGCAEVFIYYLYSQLNFSFHDIITKAGDTLEATYHALTGGSGGYTDLTNLVNRFFPVGSTPQQPFDNIFPLLDSNERTVNLSFIQTPNGIPVETGRGRAHVSPFFTCPARDYSLGIYNAPQKLVFMASLYGFGQPVFSWKVNGQPLSSSSGSLMVTATVLVDDPNHPDQPKTSTQNVRINYITQADTSSYKGRSGQLALYNLTYPGHILLNVTVDVHEDRASLDVTSTSRVGQMDARYTKYESQYYIDRKACKDEFYSKLHRTLQEERLVAEWVEVILTLPDPPPDLYTSVQVLIQLGKEVQRVAKKDPQIALEIGAVLAQQLNISPHILSGVMVKEHSKGTKS